MTYFDVFNGDADGICALTQWRLANPVEQAIRITGVKRDIALLSRVEAESGDDVTVLDISLDRNREDLEKVLAAGGRVMYADHHYPGEIPIHSALHTHIDTDPNTCTSLIINQLLADRFAAWAITGAFGDNMLTRANALAQKIGLSEKAVNQLQALGIYLNYNGYGETLDDLHITPDTLFQQTLRYANPLHFIEEDSTTFATLEAGYRDDMQAAEHTPFESVSASAAVAILPAAAWARRVSGVYANELANLAPERAHALLTCKPEGGYLVSIRAPLMRKTGADTFCRRYPGGGGRSAAGGINHLSEAQLAPFVDDFQAFFYH
ncbi:DHHA1 domain-containing protein [Halomonas sp. NYA30]